MATKKKATSTVTIKGTCSGTPLDKRTYLPGIVIRCACPKCGAPWKRDMAHDYLSYPEVGKPENAHGYCAKCRHEWPVMVVVRMTLEPA